MDVNLIVIDDFYTDPDEVRKEALAKDFTITGSYPGLRTECLEPEMHTEIGRYLQNRIVHEHITYWPEGYNTAYQYTVGTDETWVHHDATIWAGVLYLTPNPPANSGTSMYRKKSSGIYKWDFVEDSESDYNSDWDSMQNLDDWELEMTVENRYNRLILYKGALYHRSTTSGFGDSKENGRLFQTFFFNTGT